MNFSLYFPKVLKYNEFIIIRDGKEFMAWKNRKNAYMMP